MSSPTEQIREHLELTGRPGKTTAEKLLAQWGLDGNLPADRERVAQELTAAGLRTEPALTRVTDPGAPLQVELLDEVSAERLSRAQQAAGWTKPIPEPRRERETAGAPASPAPSEPAASPEARRDSALLVGGAVLIVLSLFLPWYSGDVGGQEIDDLSSGWQWLTLLDIGLVGLAVGAVALSAIRDELVARVVLGAGAVALFCTTVRIVSPPEGPVDNFAVDTSLSVGPFVATAGAAAVVIAAGTVSGLLGPRPARADRT